MKDEVSIKFVEKCCFQFGVLDILARCFFTASRRLLNRISVGRNEKVSLPFFQNVF